MTSLDCNSAFRRRHPSCRNATSGIPHYIARPSVQQRRRKRCEMKNEHVAQTFRLPQVLSFSFPPALSVLRGAYPMMHLGRMQGWILAHEHSLRIRLGVSRFHTCSTEQKVEMTVLVCTQESWSDENYTAESALNLVINNRVSCRLLEFFQTLAFPVSPKNMFRVS